MEAATCPCVEPIQANQAPYTFLAKICCPIQYLTPELTGIFQFTLCKLNAF